MFFFYGSKDDIDFINSLPEALPDLIVGNNSVVRGQLDRLLDVDQLVSLVELLSHIVVAAEEVIIDLTALDDYLHSHIPFLQDNKFYEF